MVTLSLPDCAEIVYSNLDGYEVDDYDEDILLVRLPDRIFVDLGWYSQGDPAGHFAITVYRGDWSELLEKETTKDLSKAVALVDELANKHANRCARSS